MFNPVSLFIGLRYTRAKRRNHYISFISLTSMIGIALGIAVLITVLSVMNGFDQQIRKQIFSMAQQLSIGHMSGSFQNWPALANDLKKNEPEVIASSPFVAKEGLLNAQGKVQAAYVFGVIPEQYPEVSAVKDKIVAGTWESLKPKQFNIVLGAGLAQTLGLTVNDKVTLVTTQASLSPVGVLPRFKILTVGGIFSSGNGSEFDRAFAFMNMQDAQVLYRMGDAVSGLQLKLTDLYQAPALHNELMTKLPDYFIVNDWTSDYGSLFEAIKLEKRMMFIILSMIIAVAAFNLVSSLVMVVTDKKADIAILRTFGAKAHTIMNIFIVQGFLIGIIGTLLGVILGVILAYNVSDFVSFLEHVLGVQFISSNIYYVDYLPSELHWVDVIKIAIAALLMSLVATLYPAWRASKIEPAEALRYE